MLQPESSTVYRYTIIAPLLGVWHGCLLAHGGGLTRFYFDGSIRHLIYGFHDGWYTTQLGLWSLMCHFHASKAISRCPGAEPPPHQCSSAPSVTLATSALARPLQVGHVRPPVVVWRFAIVPGHAVLSPTLVSGGCVPQRAEHASWRGHTVPSATERSQLLDPDYGSLPSHLKDADLSYDEFRRSFSSAFQSLVRFSRLMSIL